MGAEGVKLGKDSGGAGRDEAHHEGGAALGREQALHGQVVGPTICDDEGHPQEQPIRYV